MYSRSPSKKTPALPSIGEQNSDEEASARIPDGAGDANPFIVAKQVQQIQLAPVVGNDEADKIFNEQLKEM